MISIPLKKILSSISFFIALATLPACNQSAKVSTEGLTSSEKKAVIYVENHLERSQELQDYQICEAPIPLAAYPDRFKAIRDAIYKAQLDRENAIKRGIPAEIFNSKLEACQKQLVDIIADYDSNDSKQLIVLAHIKNKSGAVWSLIAAFDSSTGAPAVWTPVTTPVVNTAIILLNARENRIVTDGLLCPEWASLNSATEIDRFIIGSNPL